MTIKDVDLKKYGYQTYEPQKLRNSKYTKLKEDESSFISRLLENVETLSCSHFKTECRNN